MGQGPSSASSCSTSSDCSDEDDLLGRPAWEPIACRSAEGESPPCVRSGHTSMVHGDSLFVFGGYVDSLQIGRRCLSDMHELSLVDFSWRRVDVPEPLPRASHSWCMGGEHLYLLGGSGEQWGLSNRADLQRFDFASRAWQPVEQRGHPPPPSYGHSLCEFQSSYGQPGGRVLVLFGGTTGVEYSNATFIFELDTCTWRRMVTTGERPSERYRHCAVVVDGQMLVVGGGLFAAPNTAIDVFSLDLSSGHWKMIVAYGAVPEARIAHSVSRLPGQRKLVMFGGRNSGGVRLNDMFTFCLSTGRWCCLHGNDQDDSPCRRDFHSAALHKGQMLIFGGSVGQDRLNDVLRFRFDNTPPPLSVLCLKAAQRARADGHVVDGHALLPLELRVAIDTLHADALDVPWSSSRK